MKPPILDDEPDEHDFEPHSCTYNCVPIYQKSLPITFASNSCAGDPSVNLSRLETAHYAAYKIAHCALRTLLKLTKLPEKTRNFLWRWGMVLGGDDAKKIYKIPHTAPTAALAYWFGFSVEPAKLLWMWSLFNAYVVRTINTTTKYKCAAAYVHRSVNDGWTSLGPDFFTGTSKHRVYKLLHMGLWGTKNGNPYEVSHPWCPGSNCNANPAEATTWTFGWGLNDPKTLALSGPVGRQLAGVNVDNYVSWAIRRWEDSSWGECDIPRQVCKPPSGMVISPKSKSFGEPASEADRFAPFSESAPAGAHWGRR